MSDSAAASPSGEAPPSPEGGPRRRARNALALLALAAAALAAAWYAGYEFSGRYFQTTNDAEVRADFVTIAPRVAGYVSQVDVSENQDVAAGQPLVRIDARNYRAKAAEAQAEIALADAGLAVARAGLDEQQDQIAAARARLSAATARAAADASEVARYAPLAATDAEPREKLAQLRAAAAQSAADEKAAAAALHGQERHIAALTAESRQGEAQVESARAKLATASVDVDAAELRAPIAGRIGDKTVALGQYVQAGTRLMSLAPLSGVYVTANFKETQVGLIRPGQPASISVDALKGTVVRGRVESLSPATGAQFSLLPPENATGNFTKIVQRVPVRIAIEAGPQVRRLLLPGLSATVTVDTLSARGAREALTREAGATR